MCLAIHKPAKAIIPIDHLESGYEGNPHGCGFCYSENGKLHIVKGMLTFPQFYKQYKEKEHLAMLIHFRWATHACKTALNCHPFSICNGKYALIHNGIIPIVCSMEKLSDTGNFAKLVMEPMLNAGIHPRKPSFFFLVEQALGEGNKVALMDWRGQVTIYNEDNGCYEYAVDKNKDEITFLGKDGKRYNERVWYSNSGYKAVRRVSTRHHQDEYEGYFDGGAGMCGVAEMPTNLESGFAGIPSTETNSQFGKKPLLDPPPSNIIVGFKPTGEKDAEQSANAMSDAMAAGAPIINRNGKYPPNVPVSQKKDTIRIILPPKQTVETNPAPAMFKASSAAHTVTEIESGPIFDAKTELEIAYLVSEMNMNRIEAMDSLKLDIKDALTIIEA